MKRYISLILMLAVILAVMFVLQACGGKNETTPDPTVGQTPAPTESTDPTETEEWNEDEWSTESDVEWSE